MAITVKPQTRKLLRFLAWSIIFGSHVYMIVYGLPESQMVAHAIGNIVAGGILWYIN